MNTALTRISSGHVGHFSDPPEDSYYFDGDLFSVKSAPHPGEIKFQGIFVPPYANLVQDYQNNNMTVFGPWFSLLFETALKLNYSLIGKTLGNEGNEGKQTEMWSNVFSFRPDIMFCPFLANSPAMLEGFEMGLVLYSKVLRVAQFDHILSRRGHKRPNILAMLAPFDRLSLALIGIALVAVSFFAFRFAGNNKNSLMKIFWHFITAMLNPPSIDNTSATWRLVGLSWLLSIWVLQSLFGGDMFTAMAKPPELDVADTYEELYLKSSNKTITVFEGEEASGERYLSQEIPYRDELAKRIRVIPLEQMYDDKTIEQILKNVSSGEQYHIGVSHILKQYKNAWFDGEYSEKVYISSEHGESIPVFLLLNPYSEPVFLQTFNKIVVTTRESGLYQSWVNAYEIQDWLTQTALASYEEAKLKHFFGLVAIYFIFIIVSLLGFCFELTKQTITKHYYERNSA